jgi:hypothetical protein
MFQEDMMHNQFIWQCKCWNKTMTARPPNWVAQIGLHTMHNTLPHNHMHWLYCCCSYMQLPPQHKSIPAMTEKT